LLLYILYDFIYSNMIYNTINNCLNHHSIYSDIIEKLLTRNVTVERNRELLIKRRASEIAFLNTINNRIEV